MEPLICRITIIRPSHDIHTSATWRTHTHPLPSLSKTLNASLSSSSVSSSCIFFAIIVKNSLKSIEPLPVGEHLVNMPEGFEDSLQEQVETKVHEHMQAAVTGAWKKVWDALDGIVARAMTPEIIFKRSLLDKLENCLDTVRGFNVLDDSDYEKLITDIENDIMRRDAKDYRADPDLMRGLAHYAQKHRDKIGGLTGRSDDSVSLPCETVPVPAPAQSDEPANVPETPSEAIQALVEDAEADGMPTTLPDPFVPPAEPLEQLQPESTEESEDSLDDLLSSLLG